MRLIGLALGLWLAVATPVRASELAWAKALYVGLALADWSQTRWLHTHGIPETNPLILGTSPEAINLSVGSAILAVLATVEWFPAPWNERLLFVAIGVEFDAVRHNNAIGVRVVW